MGSYAGSRNPTSDTFEVGAVTLIVVRGPDEGRSARIDQPRFVVGSGESDDFRLTDPSVSSAHLVIAKSPEGVRVCDGDSKSGTFLGRTQLKDAVLTYDTLLTLGATTLSVSVTPELDDAPFSMSAHNQFGDAIGSSMVMRHLFGRLEQAAASELTILMEGESGVGKDVLARAIHSKSSRAAGPFVVVDCGAIPPHLVESELFGHERGAFTGADRTRRGVVDEANGGTLFLDEVGELPLDVQPKLLRVIEQREVRSVGGQTTRPVDIRFIAATNRRLREAAGTGAFRSDLYYRLAVVRVVVPPLRERAEDILPIARSILRSAKPGADTSFPEDFAAMLQAYPWPGNVRELRNVVERYAIFGVEPKELFDHHYGAPVWRAHGLTEVGYHEARKRVLDSFDEHYLEELLKEADGVVATAAERAGLARTSFYKMLERVRRARRELETGLQQPALLPRRDES